MCGHKLLGPELWRWTATDSGWKPFWTDRPEASKSCMYFITVKELSTVHVVLLLLFYVKYVLNSMFNWFYYIIYMLIKRSLKIPHSNQMLLTLYFIMVGGNRQIFKNIALNCQPSLIINIIII